MNYLADMNGQLNISTSFIRQKMFLLIIYSDSDSDLIDHF